MYQAGTVRNVSAYINRLRTTYTNSPKYLNKSAPMIGLVTSAIVNFHVNDLAIPRSTCTDLSPNVRIVVYRQKHFDGPHDKAVTH